MNKSRMLLYINVTGDGEDWGLGIGDWGLGKFFFPYTPKPLHP
ncbi:hypothetical protein [Anabaena sp. CCY 9910]